MEGLSSAGPSEALPEGAGGEPAGITVPSRELRLLIQGLRTWYSRPPGGEPAGSLGLITGEAGAGKTLLIGALRGALRTLGIRFHGTACYREHVPLEPVRDLLAQLLGEPAPGAALEPFASELCRLVQGPDWLAAVPPFPSLSPDLDRIRVSDNIAQTIASFASPGPLVLTLENLQCIDPLSLDAVTALLRIAHYRSGSPEAPRLLLVATLRPEQAAGLERILDPRLRAFHVEVRGYSREDVRDHAMSLGIDLPLTAREALHRGAGGRPQRVLYCLSGVRPGDKPNLGSLPEDPSRFEDWFARLVLGRLGALGAAERRAVQLLAALGRPHSSSFLASLWSLPPGNAAAPEPSPGQPADPFPLLFRLEAAGWIRRGVAADRGQGWVISGEKIAKLVLESLLPAERAALHRRIGEVLLAMALEAPIESPPAARKGSWNEIFFHLVEGTAHPRLVEVGMAAAREAEAISASARAIEIHERLLEAVNPSAEPGLYREIGDKLAALLGSTGFYREAIEIHHKLGTGRLESDSEMKARRFRLMGALHGELEEKESEIKCYRAGLEATTGAEPSLERLKLGALLARVSPDSEDREKSMRQLRDLGKLIEEGKEVPPRERLAVYRLAEEAHHSRGEHLEALAFEEKIFEVSSAAGDRLELLTSAEHQGHLHLLRGDRERALGFLERALVLAQESGNRLLIARFLAQLGNLHRSSDDPALALTHLSRSRDMFLELGREDQATRLLPAMAHLELSLHDFRAAALSLKRFGVEPPPPEAAPAPRGVLPPSYADRSEREALLADLRARLQKLEAEPGAPGRADLLSRAAELLVDGGEYREAGRLYEEALRSKEAVTSPLGLAEILQRAGRLHRLLGDRSRALRCFEKSLEFLRRNPERTLLANAYLEVGSIFLVQGEAGKAFDYLLRGLRLYVDLENREGLTMAALRLAEFLREVGLREAASLLAESVVALCRGDRKRWEAEAHRLWGAIASEGGDYAASARWFSKAQGILEAQGLPSEGAWLRLELGWESYRRENYPAALAIAREGIEAARALGAQDALEDFLFLLGAVESALSNKKKNFLRALEVLNQALLGAQKRGRPSIEAQILLAIALIYDERGKSELGREFRERARAIIDALAQRLPPLIRRAVDAERSSDVESAPLTLETAR